MEAASQSTDVVEISIAKGSVILRLCLALIFSIGSFNMWRSNQHHVIGGILALLFASVIPVALRLLFDTKAGLVLNETGLVINSKIGIGGNVPWSDVKNFSLVRFGNGSYYKLVVMVKQPQQYLSRGNVFYRMLVSMSTSRFGSPVSISTSLLAYDRNNLLQVANQFRTGYGGA